ETHAQSRSGGFKGALKLAGSEIRSVVRADKQQRERGDDQRAGGVKKTLEQVDSKQAGHRQLLPPRQQERADRFSRPAEQEDRGKASQGQPVDGREVRRTEVLLQDAPAQGAQGVTSVDGQNRQAE